MNNGDMPASPIMCDKGYPTHYSFLLNATLGDDKIASGLTKREYLYFKILSENIENLSDGFVPRNYKASCEIARAITDIALEELEK